MHKYVFNSWTYSIAKESTIDWENTTNISKTTNYLNYLRETFSMDGHEKH